MAQSTEELRSKLIKLLNLTSSPNDHEALSAIRMANKALKSSDLSWENLSSNIENKTEATLVIDNIVKVILGYSWRDKDRIRIITQRWRVNGKMRKNDFEYLYECFCEVTFK